MTTATSKNLRWWFFSVLLFALFLGRIAYLYTICSDTYDEHAHLIEPLWWLESGAFRGDGFHSPLPRLLIAAGPWLAGFRSDTPWLLNNWASQDLDGYWRSLTLARLGVLPFAALLFWTVALWSRALYGSLGSFASTVALSCCPMIIGHAAVAALDVPGAAGVTVALLAIWHWMRTGSAKAAVLAGAALGFAQMCKFSAFGFLLVPAGFAVTFLLLRRRLSFRAMALHLGLMPCAAFAVIWASYGFESGPIHSYRHEQAQGTPNELPLGSVLQGTPAPAPNFWKGFVDMAYLQRLGYPAMFLGESAKFGFPGYFPTALLLKATPPLLLLAVWGLLSPRRKTGGDPNPGLYLGLTVLGMIAVSIPNHLNIGVRHLMPVFPVLCLLAGAVFVISPRRSATTALAVLLLGWHIAESVWAHPDYIAYFTPPARERDYQLLSDSNLAWGQDRWRLVEWLRSHPELEVHVVGGEGIGMLTATGWVNAPEKAEWLVVDTNAASIILTQHPPHRLKPLVETTPWGRIGRSLLIFRRTATASP
jgi:4-amino-4-deoxy-L-arabinose transferase-like glycosyltransferase